MNFLNQIQSRFLTSVVNNKTTIVTASLFISLFMMSYSIDSSSEPDPRGNKYAGALACRQCHQALYDSFLVTAHNMATMPGTKKTILLDSKKEQNSFQFLDGSEVKIEMNADTVFETLYENKELQAAFPIDMVFGFKNGQTFLYWYGENTYQLPVTYYHSEKKLGTSPGYPILLPDFNRKIGRNCFECHSSYIQMLNEEEKTMNRSSLVYGIDCEACHGAAAEHVQYHIQHVNEKKAMYITLEATLNHSQQLDRCAVCHCNDANQIKSRFLFKPGDTLSDYFLHTTDHENVDVHGDQLGLLAKSKCFLKGNALTCSSCHGGHDNASRSASYYSQKCMTCHSGDKQNFCKATPATGTRLEANCIDCHMPLQSSQAINFYLAGNKTKTAQQYRTHHIAIYKN